MPCLRQFPQLVPEGLQDVCASACGAEDDLEAAALRDDEGRGLVVVRVAVCVGTDFLGLLRVQRRRAGCGCAVLTGTAVLSFVPLRAGAEAGIEDGSLDVVVWIRVHSVTWLCRRGELKRPGTPILHERRGDGLIKRERIRRIGAEIGVARVTYWREQRRSADTYRIRQVGRDIAQITVGDLANQ